MVSRSGLLATAVAASATALTGCAATSAMHSTGDGGSGCSGFGCADGGESDGGGTDAGAALDPRCPSDGGIYSSILQSQLVHNGTCPKPPNSEVILSHVVVTQVWDAYTASANGLPDGGSRVFFWVEDPLQTQYGLWVEKFTTDYAQDSTPGPDYLYVPAPGDSLDLQAFLVTDFRETFPTYNQAGRATLGEQYLISGGNASSPLFIVVNGPGTAPADNRAPGGFGNAQGGTVAASPDYAGARVHVPGPLTITRPSPTALTNFRNNTFPPQPIGWRGFEVGSPDGGPFQGILVIDDKIYQDYTYLPDGGQVAVPGRCDYAAWARDGGVVTFPSGISGVWDTYAVQLCAGPKDGGQYCSNTPGEVPLADGGALLGFTYVLWPQSCADLPDGGL
jgi:hypothetical protein